MDVRPEPGVRALAGRLRSALWKAEPSFEDNPEPGVEANARLTAVTGLLLTVMLAAEGVTILRIHPLLAWHVAIGFALIPPVGIKLASTFWRFAHYYLGDARYRLAGPPKPVLRALGPVIVVTTVAVLVTGVASWVAGPGSGDLLFLHKASFVIWFAATAVHFVAHLARALRLSRDDFRSGRSLGLPVPHRLARNVLVLGSFGAGVVVAVLTRGLAGAWDHFSHHLH